MHSRYSIFETHDITMNSITKQTPCSPPQRQFLVQAGRMRGLHASLTMLLLAVSHGYILCMNFKMGDTFSVKYPF